MNFIENIMKNLRVLRKQTGISENVSLAFDEKFADVYWHRLDNTTEHRTNFYNNSTLILRRGQPFKLGYPRKGNFAIFRSATQPHGWYFWNSFIR